MYNGQPFLIKWASIFPHLGLVGGAFDLFIEYSVSKQ